MLVAANINEYKEAIHTFKKTSLAKNNLVNLKILKESVENDFLEKRS